MSKCTSPSNKRAVPHERSVEGITKYFKPLNELINQLVPTSLSSSSSKSSPSTTPTTPKTSSRTSTTPETSSSRTSTTAKTSSSRTPTTSRASSSRTSTTAKTSSRTSTTPQTSSSRTSTTPKTSSRTSTTPQTSSSRTPTTCRASSSKTPTTSRTSSSTTPTTSGTSKVQSIHVNDVPANNTSESLISVVNTSSLLDKISHLSMNSDKATLCNSFQNIAITSTDSISSNEPDESLVFFESNADIQSSDDPEHNQSEFQHATPENSEINQRDMLATYLFQIEFHLKSCQNLIKDSTRNDISHKEFVEKTRSFVFELKTILDSLDTTCHEQIEKMNAQFSNVEFVCRKSNDAISRDPAYWPTNGKFTEEELRYLIHKGPMQPVLNDYPKNLSLVAQKTTCKFVPKWFNEYPMLEYSESIDRAFCFACRPGSEKADLAWIKTGLQSWSKMKGKGKGKKGKLEQHFTSSSHMSSMYRLSVFKNKHLNVEHLIDANHRLASQKEESIFQINKKIIETFFDCTLFLAKQGLAFHRDPQEHGNFIQLINLLCRHNPLLNSWFNDNKFKSHHVTYRSARSQDEFIEQIGTYLIRLIVQQVQNAPFYSVMIDSTPDCSHREIYSLVIRYVDNDLNIYERVIALKELPTKTGQAICDFILTILHDYQISTDCLVGQCYDNAPSMSGCRRGVQNCMKIALKRDIIHVPCGGHSANLGVKHGCECSTEYIRFFNLIEEIYDFLTSSINRYHKFRTQINSSTSAVTVKNLSITRWSANYESINAICRSLPEIINTFDLIISHIDDKVNTNEKITPDDRKTKEQSINLQKAILSFEFNLLLNFLNQVTRQTQSLTDHLQKKSLDLVTASHLLFNTNKVLMEWRNDDLFLQNLIKECDDQALRNGVDIENEFARHHHQRPRSVKIDSNSKTGIHLNRIEYYAKLMREILDYLIVSLSEYYKLIEEKLQHFCNIFPGRVNQLTLENAKKICEIVPGISSPELLYSELQLLKNDIDSYTEMTELINKIKIIRHGYPNAARIYQFLLALPITVATNERCFSKLKLIKNKLRSTLMPDKMEWLIISSAERDLLENADLSSFAEE
ncbi:unnamed protein product, partial [Rotaria sp. Silwood1]